MKKFNVTAENVCNNKKVYYNNVNLLTALIIQHHYNNGPYIKNKYCIVTTIREA